MIYKCLRCGYSIGEPEISCPRCGYLMHPEHNWMLRVSRIHSIWDFAGVLPEINRKISLGEAWTPLVLSTKLFRETTVYFKDEGRNPTGSFRDRAASIIVSDAFTMNTKRIILASDGNMAASIAAYAAKAGIPVTVHVPSWTDPEKIMLVKAYGARVIVSDKSLDELLVTVKKKAGKYGYYNASSTHNPLSIEGLKTIGLEIFLDLQHVPRNIILPLGSGLTLLSIYHGFSELKQHGLINDFPRLIGVETCGNPLYSETLYRSIKKCDEKPLPGLHYRKPSVYELVLKIIEKHGDVLVVSRKEVFKAAKKLARNEGLFVEPSSAVALAGALKISIEDETVILLTGQGLKGPREYGLASRSKRVTTLFPGTTKALILSILRDHPGLTGYNVWKKLGLRISVQAVYQHLNDLVSNGLIEARVDEGVKKYYLSRQGMRLLRVMNDLGLLKT